MTNLHSLQQYQEMLMNCEGLHGKYHKWFWNKAKTFKEVDKEISKQLMTQYKAQVKACYRNCSLIVAMRDDVDYYQGYVISQRLPIPLEHAFLVKNNNVIDPTLAIDVKDDKDRYGDEYYGVRIPKEYIMKWMFDKKTMDSMYAFHLYEREEVIQTESTGSI
jgi:hypothetical protein